MGGLCAGGDAGSSKKKGGGADFAFVPDKHRITDIWQNFDNAGELGKGASCAVYKVREKGATEESAWLALKQMVRDDEWNPKLFAQEVEILQQLTHPNILEFRDAWIDRSNFYINTVLCTGGELFDRIKELKYLPEKEGCKLMYTLMSAIHHCHSKGIVHRDLKPENIVFADGNYERIVIIDFGDALVVDEKAVYEDFVGTAFYLAPECVRSRRGWELMKSDMWTCGVICYVLLTGRPPFYGRDNREILKKILKAKLTFPKGKKQPPLSTDCKDFIKSLVKSDTTKRYDAPRALKHRWLKQVEGKYPGLKERHTKEQAMKLAAKTSSSRPREEEKQPHFPAPPEDVIEIMAPYNTCPSTHSISERTLQNIFNYHAASKLKKALARLRIGQYSTKQRKYHQQQFARLDTDMDGCLGALDLTAHLEPTTSESMRVRNILEAVTGKKNGSLNLQHYQQAVACTCLQEEVVISREFYRLDVDGDGYISKRDLLCAFAGRPAIVNEIMSESDLDHDGRLSLEEFQRAMTVGC